MHWNIYAIECDAKNGIVFLYEFLGVACHKTWIHNRYTYFFIKSEVINMYNKSYISAVYAERKRHWHMLNAISSVAALEKGASPEFKELVRKFQKEMDDLYMESSDIYHEVFYEYVGKGNNCRNNLQQKRGNSNG